MAELTQSPRLTAKGTMEMIKTPWALIVVILAAVAVLDPGNLPEVASFAVRALAHTGQYILFAVLLLSYLKAIQPYQREHPYFNIRRHLFFCKDCAIGKGYKAEFESWLTSQAPRQPGRPATVDGAAARPTPSLMGMVAAENEMSRGKKEALTPSMAGRAPGVSFRGHSSTDAFADGNGNSRK